MDFEECNTVPLYAVAQCCFFKAREQNGFGLFKHKIVNFLL